MDGASVSIPGLPVSWPAGLDSNLRMTLDGWYGTSAVRAELVPAATGGGSVPTGPWDHAEAYYTLRGLLHSPTSDRGALLAFRRALIAALPSARETPLTVLDDQDVNLTAFVRLYDKPEITLDTPNLQFSLPLVATDPLRYGTASLAGDFGVFTGSEWFRTFVLDTAPTPDRGYWIYDLDTVPAPDVATRIYTQAQSLSPFPPAAVVVSPGDAVSRRVMIAVTGPLTQGDWVITNETSDNEIYADLGLTGAQTLVFDSFSQTTTLNGTDVSNTVYGDYLTLQPGSNTFRLVSGSDSAGYATIQQALPAYQ